MRRRRRQKSNAAFAEELTKDRERIFMGFTVFYSQAGNFCSVWNPSIILLHMKKYIALIPKNNLKEGRKKKSVIILAASVLAAVGSHKKERKNI